MASIYACGCNGINLPITCPPFCHSGSTLNLFPGVSHQTHLRFDWLKIVKFIGKAEADNLKPDAVGEYK